MYVFSIFDEIAEDWSSPFCAKSVDHLKRLTSQFLNGGIVLEECVVQCLCKLEDNGMVSNNVAIFENDCGLYYDYCRMTDLFRDELKKLKGKEVEKDG